MNFCKRLVALSMQIFVSQVHGHFKQFMESSYKLAQSSKRLSWKKKQQQQDICKHVFYRFLLNSGKKFALFIIVFKNFVYNLILRSLSSFSLFMRRWDLRTDLMFVPPHLKSKLVVKSLVFISLDSRYWASCGKKHSPYFWQGFLIFNSIYANCKSFSCPYIHV